MENMNDVLTVQDLKKSYGSVKALQGISLQIPRGSVYGILGPNGSGKTTLLAILLDVLKADAGTYEWIGFTSASEARKHLGALLETPNFYHYMSAEDNLAIHARIKGKGFQDIEAVLRKVNLYERRTDAFSTFSLGMKQRLAIASALLGRPQLLVLDEPTNGLDPVGIAEIRSLIRQLHDEGTTIIMASHLLDEVEKVCTDVAILKKGILLASGSVASVMNDEEFLILQATQPADLLRILTQHPDIRIVQEAGNIHISTTMSSGEINEYCFREGVILTHLQNKKRSLESHFMEMTGEQKTRVAQESPIQ